MFQLYNKTPFAAAIAVFANEQGIDTLYTLVKATFCVLPKLSLTDVQPGPQQKDEYLDEPGQSSLILPSDYHTGKSGTDILMTGAAQSLGGRATEQLDVRLKLAHVDKTLRVFGDRHWRAGGITRPEPFTEMPLIYERAFGGSIMRGDVLEQLDERNPVGVGFNGDLSAADVDGWPLPNLENPKQLIGAHGDAPAPCGFSAVAPNWLPRRRYAGTYDEHWQRIRAPFLPADYSPKFMNAAPEDQICPGYLQGGEAVHISGMHASGDLDFALPSVHMVNRVTIAERVLEAPFVLESVHLKPNDLQVALVWRSTVVCGRQIARVRHLEVSMKR